MLYFERFARARYCQMHVSSIRVAFSLIFHNSIWVLKFMFEPVCFVSMAGKRLPNIDHTYIHNEELSSGVLLGFLMKF